MKSFEQFLKLKLEAPMANYQGQKHAGMPGSDPDFLDPQDPRHPMQMARWTGNHEPADIDVSDAFANPELYPKMFADLYQRVAALENPNQPPISWDSPSESIPIDSPMDSVE